MGANLVAMRKDTPPAPRDDAERVLDDLRRMRDYRMERLADAGLDQRLLELTRWQSARLARTHADLLHHRRSGPAIRFFLTHLYAPKDFTRRDEDLERIAPLLVKFLPPRSIRTVALSLEMNVVTEEVDRRLLAELDRLEVEVAGLEESAYFEAYRRADDRSRRERQVELLGIVGHTLDGVVHTPGAYTALRLAGPPARLAGLGELQDLLEQGFQAFHGIDGAGGFLNRIVRREMEILRRIYDGHPHPFDVGEA